LIAAQFLVLFLQSRFVSRFFSASSVQPLLDYYRFTGDIENPSEENPKPKVEDVCSICLQHFRDNPMMPKNATKKLNLLLKKTTHAKMDVVVTPCDHSFHTGCLIGWIETKAECPMCRKKVRILVVNSSIIQN